MTCGVYDFWRQTFWWTLMFYWAAGAISIGGMISTLLKFDFVSHRQWAALNFTIAFGAAMLRWSWVLCFWYDSNITQLQVNHIGLSLSFILMMIVSTLFIGFNDHFSDSRGIITRMKLNTQIHISSVYTFGL